MAIVTDLGKCECCCAGCRYAVLFYRDPARVGDDYNLYINGTYVARLPEVGPDWCDTPPGLGCRGFWVKGTLDTTTGPDDIADYASYVDPVFPFFEGGPCAGGTPALVQVTTALLDAVTADTLYVELHSVVANAAYNSSYPADGILAVYRVCTNAAHKAFLKSPSFQQTYPIDSGGLARHFGSADVTAGVQAACVTETVSPPADHATKLGARVPCCGFGVVIPSTLHLTFSGVTGTCTGIAEGDTQALDLVCPVGGGYYWGGFYEFYCDATAGDDGCLVPAGFRFVWPDSSFASYIIDAPGTLISCDPFHWRGTYSDGTCAFTVDVTA